MPVTQALIGGSPGIGKQKVKLALLRALRTLIQGIAGAFPTAGVGTAFLTTGYWRTFAFACLAAAIAALVSFLQNIASILPDPGQQEPSPAS